jgi:hypothetical protein
LTTWSFTTKPSSRDVPLKKEALLSAPPKKRNLVCVFLHRRGTISSLFFRGRTDDLVCVPLKKDNLVYVPPKKKNLVCVPSEDNLVCVPPKKDNLVCIPS